MDELRKNHIVRIELKDGTKIDGIVFDYGRDRVKVLIAFESLQDSKKMKELDELLVRVNTHLGVKQMFSHVIDTLDKSNCVTIENNETLHVVQKREFVRVLSNFSFKIVCENKTVTDCFSINISGGGIAFGAFDAHFGIGEIVELHFPNHIFDREIVCKGEIIKVRENSYVAKFLNLKPYDEDKIVKHVFKLIAEK